MDAELPNRLITVRILATKHDVAKLARIEGACVECSEKGMESAR